MFTNDRSGDVVDVELDLGPKINGELSASVLFSLLRKTVLKLVHFVVR